MRFISSALAHVFLFLILICTVLLVHIARFTRRMLGMHKRCRAPGQLRLLLTGTFYNENWFRSHILPLAATESLQRIYVVTDRPLFAVDKVSYICPPGWVLRVLGRTIPRTALMLAAAWRHRPELLMGYHIMPNAILCLLAASIFGGRAIYQMTGGPIQIVGGGVGSENILLRQLTKASPRLEALLFHVVRQFDSVVVRGERARSFVAQNRLSRCCSIVTGSVDVDRFCPDTTRRDIDIAYVSRLVPLKGLDEFLRILSRLAEMRPSLRVALVGDGPLKQDLEQTAKALKIDSHVEFLGKIEDVERILRRSRLFVLTSPSEGMSIAMLEAMATGLPVVVTDVGDLRDMVAPDHTGVLLDSTNPEDAAKAILKVLESRERRSSMSAAARTTAVARFSVEAVAQRWNTIFESSGNGHLRSSTDPEAPLAVRS